MGDYEIVNFPAAISARVNRALFNKTDPLIRTNAEHVEISHTFLGKVQTYIFSVGVCEIAVGQMAVNKLGRTWANLQVTHKVKVRPFKFSPTTQYLSSVYVNAKLSKPNLLSFDTKHMSLEFSKQYPNLALSVGQEICFYYCSPGATNETVFMLTINELEALHFAEVNDVVTKKVEIGLTTPNTVVLFEGKDINFVGDLTCNAAPPQILNPNWDFESMGIGGLSKEFSMIFRRAFASRMLPASIATQIGVSHIRGMLLYGPPGTGKTLIARQIGNLLSAREPKVVNGPEILNKYVGESEKNIRDLFAEAEEEQKKIGANSGLHMIIFDEIDAICKARSATSSSAGAGDTVVNQLLTKIDGVHALNNVLVIGMTNRRDLIDEALLRPGRMEVQMEIGLPNEAGRLEIFKIHTKQMSDNKFMSDDVDLEELASLSKNYSGAEIKGLVTAAQSLAINRVIKADGKVTLDAEKLSTIKISRNDFISAMENDVKPALGASEDRLKLLSQDPIIVWDPQIQNILDEGSRLLFNALQQDPDRGIKFNVLIVGEPGCGQTTLAANLALKANCPFVRMYGRQDTKGMVESLKVQHMDKLFNDAHRSQLSCLLIDKIEAIIEYTPIGPRFSNQILQAFSSNLEELPPKGRNRITICTCSNYQFIRDFQLENLFTMILRVPEVTRPDQVQTVLRRLAGNSCLDDGQQIDIVRRLGELTFKIGIKKLIDLITFAPADERHERVENFMSRIHVYNGQGL